MNVVVPGVAEDSGKQDQVGSGAVGVGAQLPGIRRAHLHASEPGIPGRGTGLLGQCRGDLNQDRTDPSGVAALDEYPE